MTHFNEGIRTVVWLKDVPASGSVTIKHEVIQSVEEGLALCALLREAAKKSIDGLEAYFKAQGEEA